MKLKRLLSKKQLSKVDLVTDTWEYETKVRNLRDRPGSALRDFVLQQWKLRFETDPPDEHLVMLSLKIRYDMEHKKKVEAGEEMSERFLERHKAAMQLDLQGFDAEMRLLLGLQMNNKPRATQEETMEKKKAAAAKAVATKTKNAAGKQKGPKKGETWGKLFQDNFTKKLTDAELAKEFSKRMGVDLVSEKDVVKARGFFNFGALSGAVPKPKTPLEQFKDEKEEAPKKAKKAKK